MPSPNQDVFWMTVCLEAAITSFETANRLSALSAALFALDMRAMELFEKALVVEQKTNRERLDVLQHMLEELRLRNPHPEPPQVN